MIIDRILTRCCIGERSTGNQTANAGMLKYRNENRPVSVEEIEAALSDLRKLTEGGIVEGVSGGG